MHVTSNKALKKKKKRQNQQKDRLQEFEKHDKTYQPAYYIIGKITHVPTWPFVLHVCAQHRPLLGLGRD